MNFRQYEPADLPQVIEVYSTSIRCLAAAYYTADQLAAWAPAIPDVARWQQRLDLLHTFVAEEKGVLAGFASYEKNGHLDLLFTHPEFVRRGVATQLYLKVESALRAAGVPGMFTEASLAARPFFERHGFRLEAEELVECRGARLRRFRLHKQISTA
ncbi:MAG: GNAT family N-acetyltransferase [Verrucomicrobiota bacterium]